MIFCRTAAVLIMAPMLAGIIPPTTQPATAAETPGAETAREVRFVVWGDTQFSRPDVFERAVHETEMLRPNFVIQVGDLIQGYTMDEEKAREEWRRYKAQIEPLTAPFYPVPGNHDVVTDETEKVYGEVWGQDRYYYSFDKENAHFVVLDSWWRDEDDRIAAWQRDWLAQDLEQWAQTRTESDPGHVFVFTHSPLWRYAQAHPGREDWNAVHEILRKYPTRLVIGGHTHEHVLEERDGIKYLVMNTSGGMGGTEARGGYLWSLLHVSVLGDDVRYAVIPTGSILPIDTVMNEDRSLGPRLRLTGGTLRVSQWEQGQPLDERVSFELENKLKESRRFLLDWDIPFDANLTIEPARHWVELAPGAKETFVYTITSDSAPARSRMPRLRVSTENRLRSGIVSREWESRYRERADKPTANRSAVPLETDVTFLATHSLFLPPIATALPTTPGTITIDGKFDEQAWQDAPAINLRERNGSPADPATTIRFLYDADHLYVAARMEEPNMAGVQAKAAGDIPLTWDDDDFELFFDVTESQRDYWRLFQNIAGTRFSSKERTHPDKYFQSVYTSAIHKGDDHWSLEMQIPWAETGAAKAPAPGATWGLNVGRHRPQDDEPETVWAGGLYDVTRYGVLRFAAD